MGEQEVESQECPPARPPAPCSAESAGSGVLGGNPPEREGGDRSPEAAVENWRSLLLILLASGPRPSSYHPPRPAEMRGPLEPKESRCGSQGLLAFLGLVLRAELVGRAGASHRGAGGWGQGSEGAEGRDGHARWEQARGGHRFWQHCSLLGFCPSVVGGTLMSTTLFPGDSSCAARSAICFWDTMR